MPTSTRAGRISVFTKCCGEIGRAPRADRVVRPYRTFYVFADGVCNFAIAFCRVDVGIDPYGRYARSPFVVQFRWYILPGGASPAPTVRRNAAARGDSCVQLLHTVCVLCTGIMWNTVKRVFHRWGCGKAVTFPHGLVEKKPLRFLAGLGFSTARTPYYVLLRIYSLPFYKRRGKEVLK